MTFEEFVAAEGSRLRAGLVAAYGPHDGVDAASEAMAYGWEHWDQLSAMANPVGYLFRVGQTAARRSRRVPGYLPVPSFGEIPDFEPQLIPALGRLTEHQRVSVVLVHGYSWSQAEVAELLEVTASTVHKTMQRALANLKIALEVDPHENRY